MTRDDITRMMRESGMSFHLGLSHEKVVEQLTRFAVVVDAAKRNRTWTQEHWTEYEQGIAAAERKACAEVCKEIAVKNKRVHADFELAVTIPLLCAAAIEERGAP